MLHTPDGEIRQHKPLVYQEISGSKQIVSGQYVLKETREVGFQVAGYDVSTPLVIDPVLSYSTYLGGTGFDEAFSITVDTAGSAYVTGLTTSPDFPTDHPLQPKLSGNSNAFLAKITPDGAGFVYATYLGGRNNDEARAIAVDPAGAAYITGITTSPDFPIMQPLQALMGGGIQDAFVAKLTPDGASLVYSTYLGGDGEDFGLAIALERLGLPDVTGVTTSPRFPTKNPLQPALGGLRRTRLWRS